MPQPRAVGVLNHVDTSDSVSNYYVYIYKVRSSGQEKKKGPVKRSRAVLGQSQAVKIDFRRSRILTPVANGPTASIGVTAPCRDASGSLALDARNRVIFLNNNSARANAIRAHART